MGQSAALLSFTELHGEFELIVHSHQSASVFREEAVRADCSLPAQQTQLETHW